MKKTILSLLLMAAARIAFAQTDTVQFVITINDPAAIASYTQAGIPVFANSSLNTILSGYNITIFRQEYPDSRLEYMHNVYRVRCNSEDLATDLQAADPDLFATWERVYDAELCYTPNDMTTVPGGSDYLKYIEAEDAWNVTHGHSSVVIGITDNYLNTSHPDFVDATSASKIERVGPNVPVSSHHGTAVSSIAAGGTDNGMGLPSIGFNCRIDFSSNYGPDNEILLMSKRGRRIVNGSWLNSHSPYLNLRSRFYQQDLYNEVYENGTMPCFAAGNGPGNGMNPDEFAFPASYDHVISTTSIGWKNDKPATYNVKGIHEVNIGDAVNTYNHNERVDICAPSWDIGAYRYDPTNPSWLYYTYASGTSASSPMVAGTAGLIQSALKARKGSLDVNYSPYQLEWILKKTANSAILSIPENAPYTGKLGAGALNAKNAVNENLDPNDATTQTMYIKGIEINTICAPGHASNSALPKLKPIIVNGVPPYTYVWEEVPDGTNDAVLDNENIAEPTVTGLKTGSSLNRLHYRLTVYDNSPIAQKVAMKTFKVQMVTSGYDVAMRDSYVDMLNEPNDQRLVDPRELDTWTSPDIWNRQFADAGLEHQNPEYFATNPNHIYVRVRNVGCAVSPANRKLRVYWTKASTGENWDVDWKTSDVCAIGGVLPGGREITTGAGITLPSLQPGDYTIIHQPWYPVQPDLYCGAPTKVEVCLLARIEETPSYPHGMAINEKFTYSAGYAGVGVNIRNNNNIVTRNLILTNLKPANNPTERRTLVVANGYNVASHFNFEFGTDRSIFRHFAGDFSTLGSVTLHLGDLYDEWVNAGAHGTVASHNANTRTVTFDGVNTLRLEDLPFDANEQFTIGVEFALDTPATITATSTHTFFARQYDANNPDEIFGAVNYVVTVSPDNVQNKTTGMDDIMSEAKKSFAIAPNPTSGTFTIWHSGKENNAAQISVTDMTGRKIMFEKVTFTPGMGKEVNLGAAVPGVYLVHIANADGTTEVYKVVKE